MKQKEMLKCEVFQKMAQIISWWILELELPQPEIIVLPLSGNHLYELPQEGVIPFMEPAPSLNPERDVI